MICVLQTPDRSIHVLRYPGTMMETMSAAVLDLKMDEIRCPRTHWQVDKLMMQDIDREYARWCADHGLPEPKSMSHFRGIPFLVRQ